jgi:hypothetical protein
VRFKIADLKFKRPAGLEVSGGELLVVRFDKLRIGWS